MTCSVCSCLLFIVSCKHLSSFTEDHAEAFWNLDDEKIAHHWQYLRYTKKKHVTETLIASKK